MIVRIFIVVLFLHEASLEVTVEGVIGGSVVLPCSGSADQGTPEDITVFWRHNRSRIVYDIINGKGSDDDQELEYKNRTKSFPEVYLKGNFSIQLNNLRESDTGKYSCLISEGAIPRKVELLVKGRAEKSEDQNNNQLEKSKDNNNQGEQTRPEMIVMFLLPISILVFILLKCLHGHYVEQARSTDLSLTIWNCCAKFTPTSSCQSLLSSCKNKISRSKLKSNIDCMCRAENSEKGYSICNWKNIV